MNLFDSSDFIVHVKQSSDEMSGILKYFQIKKSSSGETSLPDLNNLLDLNDLPDPNGPLSKVIPSSTIAVANKKLVPSTRC